MRKKILIVLLITCFFTFHSTAQDRVDEIDKLVTYCQENGMFNGNILVAEKGKIIYHRSIGMLDFDKETSLDLNSSFCVGSIAKQFTAFSIMLLKDMGKLNYSDKVGDLLPELPKHMHPITLKHLMQHTSGLKVRHYGEEEGLTNKDIYANFLKSDKDTLLFKPGTRFSYSNSGYMMLAMIVERVSGESFETFLTEEVWKPLGMTNTFVMSEEDRGRHNKAVGFNGYGKVSDFNVFTYGSNGIYSTTEDLFRWTQSFDTDLLMDFESKAEAWKPARSNDGKLLLDGFQQHEWQYGFGYFVYKDSLEGVVGHSGLYGGHFSFMMHDFKNDRDLIILTNNGTLPPLHDVHMSVQNILNGKPYEYPQISICWKLWADYYNDMESGLKHYHKLKKESPKKYKFSWERELNTLGYMLIADHRYAEAIKVLQLLVKEFPNRPNPHDSLGEAYFLNGQYKQSIKSYKNALKIDSSYNKAWIEDMLEKNKERLAAAKDKK